MADDEVFEISGTNRIGIEFLSEETGDLLAILVSDQFPIPDEGDRVELSSINSEQGELVDETKESDYIVQNRKFTYVKVTDTDEEGEETEEWIISRVRMKVRELNDG
ncbi:hypothetical protein HWV07_04290 [Natronomonas salina]|uniref:hypothetical protein n=1 Tax=Natronomonas salina TaxID=1710540 RepID=UPI0015B6C8E2|nr:hypothetical protein [Natronomonas salina]QLD88293.1 hypothetical protein HWV07_04290 [Natronomonas salina]